MIELGILFLGWAVVEPAGAKAHTAAAQIEKSETNG
jgi:hypothetical protein